MIDIKRVEREVGVTCDLQGLELHNELSSFVPGLHGPREMYFQRYKMQNVVLYLSICSSISVEAEARFNMFGDGLALLFGLS